MEKEEVKEISENKSVVPIKPEELKTVFEEHPALFHGPGRSKFDDPCPDSGALDISDSHAVNEWVFNHLPLSQNQKKEFLAFLELQKTKQDKKEKAVRVKELMAKDRKKKKVSSSGRKSVKDTS